jgi:hypothetical protein
MNSKGQVVLFSLMMGLILIILAIAFTSPLTQYIGGFRNTTNDIGEFSGLDCDNSSISDFQKATCLISDLTVPYFIGIVLALAGIVIGARIIIG